MKEYNRKYLIADRAYNTEPIRKCKNKEVKVED